MVEVLLSTCNGGKLLGKQLNSLLKQDYRDFFVTIRDDGSDDGTNEVIDQYIEMYPTRFRRCTAQTKSRSVTKSFAALMQQATGDYVALCGQDGIWAENKISRLVTEMMQAEAKFGQNTAVMVHCDSEVIDAEGKVTAKSLAKKRGVNPKKPSIKKMLVQCPTEGSACLLNRPLLNLTKNIPENAVSYEWWITLNAFSLGKIIYINAPLGQVREGSGIVYDKFTVQKSYWQAEALLSAHSSGIGEEKRQAVMEYSALTSQGKMNRLQKVLFGGYSQSGFGSLVRQIKFC